MLSLMRAPSRSAGMAIGYVTVGVLTMIWTGIWYYSMRDDTDAPPWQSYTCLGLFLSGLAITVIGLLLGQIGGAAKDADTTVGVAPAGPVVMPGVVAQPGVVAR